MTYPGGTPGGYPGQGPQQPNPVYGQAPSAGGGGIKLGLEQILHLATAGLGVLILFFGFMPLAGSGSFSSSFYESSFGWVPGLYLIAGLFALPAILPGDKKVGLNPAIVSVGVTLTFLFMVFSVSAMKAGGIIVLIFGIVQTIAAVGAVLLDAGVIKPPQPSSAGHFGQPGGYNPPSNQFQQQQPPAQPFGQPQQPYAPPPGQFGQAPGTVPGAPGTPPGGYPQQG
jgi:hypothetical protein